MVLIFWISSVADKENDRDECLVSLSLWLVFSIFILDQQIENFKMLLVDLSQVKSEQVVFQSLCT